MLMSLLAAVVIGYAIIAGLAHLVADRLIFLPPGASYRDGQLPIARVPSGDDAIALLHLPNPSARYTILYSHGNAEDLGGAVYVMRELHALGFAVIGYDYRGYGLSSGGPPTAVKAGQDIEAAYDYAVRTPGVRPEQLIVYGRSVGSGPTMQLASARPVAGVILESPFTSTYRVMTRVRVLPFDRFPNLTHIRRVHAPILIMHGKRDQVIPFSHGQRLYAAAREPKQSLWVDAASHNDVAEVAGQRYAAALRSFTQLLDSRMAGRTANE